MPTRFRDLTNVNFGTLNSNKNKNVIRYNSTTGKFETITIDTLLSFSTNPPDAIIDIIQENVNTVGLEVKTIDGGTF